MRPTPDEAILELRRLVLADFGDLPPRLRWVLSRADAWDAIHTYKSATTTELIDFVRQDAELAEIALYIRQLPLLESLARTFTTQKPAVFDQDDIHQSAAVELLELAADRSRNSADLPTHFHGAIRARLAEEVEQLDKPIGVPRRTANRVREALRACDGNPSAAARWAAAKRDYMSAEGFWAAYTAMFNRPIPIEDRPDYAADDALDDVDNRLLVHHLLSRGILSDREIEVLQRTYLYTGSERPTDQEIGDSMGLSRTRIVHLRRDALEALKSELGQMEETGELEWQSAA